MLTEKDLEEFWSDYPEPYIQDGIDKKHLNKYLDQNIKVLFILKESNESCNIETGKQLTEGHKSLYDPDGWFGMYAAGNRSACGMITKMIKMYRYISGGNKESHVKDFSASKDFIYNFAFININKHGNGGMSADYKNLTGTFEKDKDRIKRQIELISPDVIVSGVKEIDIKNIVSPDLVFIQTKHFSRVSYKAFEEECKKQWNKIQLLRGEKKTMNIEETIKKVDSGEINPMELPEEELDALLDAMAGKIGATKESIAAHEANIARLEKENEELRKKLKED